LEAGYQFTDRFGAELEYANLIQQFDEYADQWQSRTDHRFGMSFITKLTAKTSIFAQYRHTMADYQDQNDGLGIYGYEGQNIHWSDSTSMDYTLNDYFIGLRFAPGGKIAGEVKFGYGEKDYANSFDPFGAKYESENSWIAETLLTYSPVERTLLSINLQRAYDGTPDWDSASYLSTLLGVELDHKLTERINLGLALGWQYDDYLNEVSGLPKKYFNIYSAKAKVECEFYKYISGGLEYVYKNKTASDSLYDDDAYEKSVASFVMDVSF
jgi:hypothetical protein